MLSSGAACIRRDVFYLHNQRRYLDHRKRDTRMSVPFFYYLRKLERGQDLKANVPSEKREVASIAGRNSPVDCF